MNQLIRQLERIRSTTRALLVTREACSLLVSTVLWIMILVVLDYLFLFPSLVRLFLLLVGCTLFLHRVRRNLLPAISFHPSMIKMALRAEHHVPRLSQRLASAVDFSMSGSDSENELAASSVRSVNDMVSKDDLDGMVNTAPARNMLLITLLLGALVSVIFMTTPSLASTGVRRVLMPFGSARWPATTRLDTRLSDGSIHPEGVPFPMSVELVEGDPDSTRVSADYTIRRSDSESRTQSTVLARQDESRFERIITPVGDELTISFNTFDFQTEPVTIRLVPPPYVLSASLSVSPPDYATDVMEKIDLDLGGGTDPRATPEASFLQGSRASIDFVLNKEIPVPESDHERWLSETFGELAEDAEFTRVDATNWRIDRVLDESMGSVVTLVDEHGISNIEEISYGFQVTPDREPSAAIIQPSMDETVLPDAIVEIIAEVRDDIAVDGSRIDVTGSSGEDPLVSVDGGGGAESVRIEHDLDLSLIGVVPGDVLEITAHGVDGFESNGETHDEARSTPRRLLVISDTDFTEIIRGELASVRRNAIRLDSMQNDAQQRVRNGGMRVAGDQSRIGERLANTTEAVQEMRDRIKRNRLDDPMLEEMLRQSEDILMEAARSSAEAGDLMESNEERLESMASSSTAESGSVPDQPNQAASGTQGTPGDRADQGDREVQGTLDDRGTSENRSDQGTEGNQDAGGEQGGSQGGESTSDDATPPGERGGNPDSGQQSGTTGETSPREESTSDGNASDSSTGSPSNDSGESPGGDGSNENSETAEASDPEVREIIEKQQEVRDELEDLIALLDRDEDAWVVTREVESMLEEANELLEETREAGRSTVGRARGDLDQSERSEIDRIAERQRDAARRSQDLADDLRDRSRVLEETDQQRSESLDSAARRAERSDLSRTMEEAAQQIQENRMANAQQSQEAAVETLERMLEDLEENDRARAEQLIRQLSSLIQSIERLVKMNEDELIMLERTRSPEGVFVVDDLLARSESIIRLVRNTESVADEARSSGPETQRISRSVDRAASAQGRAISSIRSDDPDPDDAKFQLESSLSELNSALEQARAAEQQAREEEAERQREELADLYKKIAEKQVGIRVETQTLVDAEAFTRRELVKSRKLAIQQESVRIDLRTIQEENPELDDSILFERMHEIMDSWSTEVGESLQDGKVDGFTLDRQELIIEGLLNLINALGDGDDDDENPFEQNQPSNNQQSGSSSQEGQETPLVPPLAELKLLRNMQDMIYARTRRLSGIIESGSADSDRVQSTLSEISTMQGDLHELGITLLESMQEDSPGSGPDVAPVGDPVESEER